MNLKAVILENFRGYAGTVRIPIDSVTAFVGKNDVGKSTVLEALEIFFNSELVKMDSKDPCAWTESSVVRIGCVFDDLPDAVVLDSSMRTDLAEECLLNLDGDLEVHKIYDCTRSKIAPEVVIVANHPTAEGAGDLLRLKNRDLKARARQFEVDTSEVNLGVNAELRRAIRAAIGDLAPAVSEIQVSGLAEDAKSIYPAIQRELPGFVLFQADRPSRDNDDAVQDPMAVAVKQAIADVQEQLDQVQERVRAAATAVAERTLEKLRDVDEGLEPVVKLRAGTGARWRDERANRVSNRCER